MLIAREKERRCCRSVSCLDFNKTLTPCRIKRKDVVARSVAFLLCDPAHIARQTMEAGSGKPRLFHFQYKFLACFSQRAIEPVPLDRIELSDQLVEPRRRLFGACRQRRRGHKNFRLDRSWTVDRRWS